MRISDWSSDVCSSDLAVAMAVGDGSLGAAKAEVVTGFEAQRPTVLAVAMQAQCLGRLDDAQFGRMVGQGLDAIHARTRSARCSAGIQTIQSRSVDLAPSPPFAIGAFERQRQPIEEHQGCLGRFRLEAQPPLKARALYHLGIERVDRMGGQSRSEEHTSELQSLMRISYAVFCLQKKNTQPQQSNKTSLKV